MIGWILIVLLAAVGGYDVYLVVKDHPTISQKYHALFPQWLDYVIMGVTGAVVWWLFAETVFAIFAIGIVVGHLCWHEE